MNRICGKSKTSGTIAGKISSMCSTMAACQPPCTMKIDLQLDSVVPQAQSAAAGLMNSKKNKKQGRAGIILRVKRRGSIATKFRAQTLSCFQLRVRRRSPLDAQTQPLAFDIYVHPLLALTDLFNQGDQRSIGIGVDGGMAMSGSHRADRFRTGKIVQKLVIIAD